MNRDQLEAQARKQFRLMEWQDWNTPNIFTIFFHVKNYRTPDEVVYYQFNGNKDGVCGIHLDLVSESDQIDLDGDMIIMPGLMLKVEGYDPERSVFIASLIECDPVLEYDGGGDAEQRSN